MKTWKSLKVPIKLDANYTLLDNNSITLRFDLFHTLIPQRASTSIKHVPKEKCSNDLRD